jgi:hypothetical protein
MALMIGAKLLLSATMAFTIFCINIDTSAPYCWKIFYGVVENSNSVVAMSKAKKAEEEKKKKIYYEKKEKKAKEVKK